MDVKSFASTYCPPFLRPMFQRVKRSPLGYRLTKGIFWSMAGAILSRGLMTAAMVLVARILGKEVFGELGVFRSTVDMFAIFAGFGLGLTSIKYVSEFRQSDPTRAGRIIALSSVFAIVTGGIMAVGLFVFAPWLASSTLNAPHLTGILRIGGVMLFINALNGAQTGALSGLEAFRTIARVNLFVGVSAFPLLLIGAYCNGLTGAVWALAVNVGIHWLLNHLALREEARRCGLPLTFRQCSSELSILWKFSVPATLSAVLVGPVKWACNAILVNRPDGYDEMGIFAAALIFQNLLFFATNMLNAPLLSMLSNVGSAKNNKLETANILASWVLGLIPAIPLLCFPEIAEVLFGGEFRGPLFRMTFAIVVFYTSILTYRSGLLRALIARNLLWWGLGNNLLWAAVLLPATLLLARWGALGLAASFAIAYVVNSIVFIPVYMKQAGVPRRLLFSMEAGILWTIIAGLTIAVLLDAPIIYRALAFPPALGVTIWALKNTWHRNTRADCIMDGG